MPNHLVLRPDSNPEFQFDFTYALEDGSSQRKTLYAQILPGMNQVDLYEQPNSVVERSRLSRLNLGELERGQDRDRRLRVFGINDASDWIEKFIMDDSFIFDTALPIIRFEGMRYQAIQASWLFPCAQPKEIDFYQTIGNIVNSDGWNPHSNQSRVSQLLLTLAVLSFAVSFGCLAAMPFFPIPVALFTASLINEISQGEFYEMLRAYAPEALQGTDPANPLYNDNGVISPLAAEIGFGLFLAPAIGFSVMSLCFIVAYALSLSGGRTVEQLLYNGKMEEVVKDAARADYEPAVTALDDMKRFKGEKRAEVETTPLLPGPGGADSR